MQDRPNRDYELEFDDGGGTGLLSTMIRNAAVLVGLCLVLAWALGGTGGMNLGTSVASRPDPGLEQDRRHILEEEEEDGDYQARTAHYGGEEVIVPAGPLGHFLVDADVNGVQVRFLVDTGATSVTLTEADAERIGIPVRALDYTARFETANGQILAAPVTLRDMQIGGAGISNVTATVTQAPLNVSLLGMSFLNRLSGYEVSREGLVLRF